ncbi:hypothetical protein V0R37_21290, partial [Pollutimonas sp. H1-120]|uniref:hypothetical protein n=1 Tax=Pollutimonas sp. H1-120 TaxID=3148824 RepID=UPI003B529548
IRSIKLVLRKNKFNECRLSPVYDGEPSHRFNRSEALFENFPALALDQFWHPMQHPNNYEN